MWEAKPLPKGGLGAKPPSLGCFGAYIGGRRGISAPLILPTQDSRFPPVVPGFKGLSQRTILFFTVINISL